MKAPEAVLEQVDLAVVATPKTRTPRRKKVVDPIVSEMAALEPAQLAERGAAEDESSES